MPSRLYERMFISIKPSLIWWGFQIMPVKNFYISLWILFSFWALASFEFVETNLSEWEKHTSRIDLFVVDSYYQISCDGSLYALTFLIGWQWGFKALLSFIDIPYEISNLNYAFSTFVKATLRVCIEEDLPVITCLL